MKSTPRRLYASLIDSTGARLALTVFASLLLPALFLFGSRPSPVHAQSSSDPLVLAFYYTWFDENTWTYDKLSDLPAQPYASRDRGVMGRQIDQAKGAGIDAFLVAWYGPGGGNQTETNLSAMLDEAQARGFKIGILFETDSPFLNGDIAGALQHALQVHAQHPAFLRVDGRPVIFFWHPSNYGVDFWRGVRSQVDPNYSSIWISEGVNTAYLSVFDGHHLYSNTWNPPADLGYTNAKFARLVDAARQQYGAYKFWVATVMPGYNDVRIRPGYGFAQDREGGAYYQRSWQAAIASHPNWVVITSFNEWPEGTYIEPSAAFGDQYLGLTAAGSQQFKSGGGANVQAAAVQPPPPLPTPTPEPSPTPFPEPTTPTAYVVVDLANLRGGPGTDFSIEGQVTAGAALPISGRDPAHSDWWQVTNEGKVSWIYAELVHAGGPLDQVPVVESAPVDTTAVTSDTGSVTKPLYDPQTVAVKPYLSH